MKQDDDTMTSASLAARTSAEKKPISSMQSRAEENLKFIRETIEGAASFTSISGIGLIFTGLIGLIAAWLDLTTNQSPAAAPSLTIWMTALIIAVSGSTACTLLKARKQGTTLLSASGRKLLYAFTPTMLVGGIITYFIAAAELASLLPGIWLSLYGAAVMTAGAHSVAMIKAVGACFILLGVTAFMAPAYSALILALGFGGLHLSAGYLIWKYYGG